MKKNILFIIITVILTGSCKQQKKEFFNGKIVEFELINEIDTLTGTKVLLDGIYTGYMSVYDSLISFTSHQYPQEYLYVFSLNSGKHLASTCTKGEGPKDFSEFSHEAQYVEENNEIKLWTYDSYKKNTLINLTKSIQNKETEIDSILPVSWLREHTIYWNACFILNDGKFIIKSQPESIYINGKSREPYTYHLYQNTFNNKVNSYELYKNIFDSKEAIYHSDRTLSSWDGIHPSNKDKIAMVMLGVPQINILNITTGELKGIRLNNFDVETLLHSQSHIYYRAISVSDDHIYTLYTNLEIDENGKNFSACTNEVHVFDWEGNLVRRIFLEQGMVQIAFNPIDKKLYGMNNEDEVFQFLIK